MNWFGRLHGGDWFLVRAPLSKRVEVMNPTQQSWNHYCRLARMSTVAGARGVIRLSFTTKPTLDIGRVWNGSIRSSMNSGLQNRRPLISPYLEFLITKLSIVTAPVLILFTDPPKTINENLPVLAFSFQLPRNSALVLLNGEYV